MSKLLPSRPRCRFCHNVASFALGVSVAAKGAPGASVACAECWSLVRWRQWDRLAERWLQNRPEDWADDVAAFLEHALSSRS